MMPEVYVVYFFRILRIDKERVGNVGLLSDAYNGFV